MLFLIAAALVLSVVGGFLGSDGLLPEGSDAPAFDLEKLAGGRVTSAELKGKVVLLDFWATWCPPCREELPWLTQVASEYEAKGVHFVAASRDDETGVVAPFVKTHHPQLAKYVVFSDPFTGGKYRVEALPTLYVIGRDGKVVASARGETREWRVRRWLDAALEAKP